MNTLARTSLLAVFAACGVATAIALAMQAPPQEPAASLPDQPAASGPREPHPGQAPVVAEYRDPVAGQFSLLDAAISKTRPRSCPTS